MELGEIAAITGMPGLYKITARRNDGLIVTSLIDGKTQFVSGRTHMFTTLDSITMYTTDEPAELKTVLASIKEKEKNSPVPDGKDDAAIKAWMETVLPTYDKEKVYVSDMKKLAKWYSLLNSKNLIEELLADKPEEKEAEEVTEDTAKKVKTAKDDKPKKESKPKVTKADKASSKANTKPAPAAKKVTAPRKAQ
ncbi:MAG: DUF5606 domain-containing protein [Chitinophagales bacterium]|nr:DUF5606 domain-containing protein [Chitinophagales bacterium]